MESKTKIILGVAAVLGIAYFTRDKWMGKLSKDKVSDNSSQFLGNNVSPNYSSRKIKKKEPTYTDPKTGEIFVKNSTGAWILK
jgi:hypothetical protein